MSPPVGALRALLAQGPDLSPGAPLWSATFDVVVAPPHLNADRRVDVVRHFAAEALAHRAQTSPLDILAPGQQARVDFHAPTLLAATVRLDPAQGQGHGALTLCGTTDQISTVALAASPVLLAAPETWPDKGSLEIETPTLRLVGGRVRVPVRAQSVLARALGVAVPGDWRPGRPAQIFGPDSGMSVMVDAGPPPRVWIELTAGGIEFDVAVNDPFARLFGQLEDVLALRLAMRPSGRDGRAELGVVGGNADGLKLAARLVATQRLLNGHGAALRWEIAPRAQAQAWPLEKTGGVWRAVNSRISLDRDSVRATLLSQGSPPQAAQFSPATVEGVVGVDAVTLTLRGGASSPATRLDISADAGGLSVVGAGPADDCDGESLPAQPIDAFADTGELRDRLEALYVSRGLRTAADATAPVYAFAPLARGLLQFALPAATPQQPAMAETKRQALAGAVVARYGAAAAVFTVTGAAAVLAQTAASAAATRVTLRLLDPLATIDGLLFFCAAAPAGGDALPNVLAGTASLMSAPCRVGADARAGFPLSLNVAQKTLTIRAPDGVDARAPGADQPIAWVAHPRMALVSAMPMTRVASSPLPSATRDLCPCAAPFALTLTLRENGFPALGQHPGPLASGWPSPAAPGDAADPEALETPAVAFAPLTLPGVEFAPDAAAADPFAAPAVSLRFDLPVLGEYFAGVSTPAPAQAATPEQAKPAAHTAPVTALDQDTLSEAWRKSARRLALTRTMGDRVTPWKRVGEKPVAVNVTELMRPLVWPAWFAFREAAPGALPLGSYSLVNADAPDDWANPQQALQGLTKSFLPTGATIKIDEAGDLRVVGFSPAMRHDGDLCTDARGHGLASRPAPAAPGSARLRQARGGADSAQAFRLASIAPTPLHGVAFKSSPAAAGVRFAARDLPVSAQDPAIFTADVAGLADDELRVAQLGGGLSRAGFSGALMEWRLFEEVAVDARPRFTIALGPLAFRPLRLVEAKLDAHGALSTLTVIGAVELSGLDDGGPLSPFDDDAPYASGNLAALTWEGGALAKVQSVVKAGNGGVAVLKLDPAAPRLTFDIEVTSEAVRSPFALEARLQGGAGAVDLSDIALSGPLLGAPTRLRGATLTVEADASPTFSFAFPADFAVNVFHVSAARLTRRAADGAWSLALDGRVDLALQENGAAGPCLLRLGVGGQTHRILDTKLEAGARTGVIDHARGALRWSMTAATVILRAMRGLTITANELSGAAMLAVEPGASDADQSVGQPFARPVSAGLAIFADAEGAVALTLSLSGGAAKLKCSGAATLSPPQTTDSLIEWPTPAPVVEGGDYIALSVSSGAATLTHRLDLALSRLPVPLDALQREVGGAEPGALYLAGPWRARVVCAHHLRSGPADDAPGLSWDTIEDISFHDWTRLRGATAPDRIDPAKPAAYAFSPRYKDESASSRLIASAGIVARELAGAGFPTRQLNKRFAAVAAGDEALIIAGGALAEIAFPGGRTQLALPWFACLGAAEDNGGLRAALKIRQKPNNGGASIALSREAAAAGPPEPAASCVFLDIADGGADDVARCLAAAGLSPPSAMISMAAFFNSPDYLGSGAPDPGGDAALRPMFPRPMLALARMWGAGARGQLEASTLFGLPDDLARIAARRRAQAPAAAAPAPAAPAATLCVLTREAVVTGLPDAPDRRAWQAGAVTQEPLAILSAIDGSSSGGPYAGADARTLPAVAASRQPGRRLRCNKQWIGPSRALGWPVAAPAPAGLDDVLALGEETPVQDLETAWAGRARTLGVARRALAVGAAPIFLAAGRKTLFPQSENGLAPPDAALAAAQPRARAPLDSTLRKALIDAGGDPGALAPFLPGAIEIVSAGGRAGTLGLDHHGLIVAAAGKDEDTAFDPSFPRFGRAAHRAPVVAAALRHPRSSDLPEQADLALRRLTFVAENLKDDVALLRHLAFRGAMTVARASGEQLGVADSPKKLFGVRLTCALAKMSLDGAWTGDLELRAVAPEAEDRLNDWLARLGFRGDGSPAAMRADLLVGAQRFPFETLQVVQDVEYGPARLTLSLASQRLLDAARAIVEAAPDAGIALILRLAAPDPLALHVQGVQTLAATPETVLAGGATPRRVLTLALQRGVAGVAAPPVPVVTVAFGDPAYDRTLASATKAQTLTEGGVSWLLALDRAEYDPSASVHLAAGPLVAAAVGAPVSFGAAPAEVNMTLAIKLIEPGRADDGRTLTIDGVADFASVHSLQACAAVAIALNALREKTGEPADIPPGCRLSFTVKAGAVTLTVYAQVVARPTFAAAEAAYGVVGRGETLDDTRRPRLEASLFASAPLPDVVEFPDLLADLAVGRVRRRALFLWRCPELAPLTGTSLVKYDLTGAGQLPQGDADFQDIET